MTETEVSTELIRRIRAFDVACTNLRNEIVRNLPAFTQGKIAEDLNDMGLSRNALRVVLDPLTYRSIFNS